MDYYSYKPLTTLQRPLVITGVPGTEVMAIARMVSSFSGLKVLLTDRKLAHALGHHPDRFTWTGAHQARWDAERALLEGVFADPSVVVGLAGHSLTRGGNLDWLRGRARTVFVREDLSVVIDRIVRTSAADEKKHWVLTDGQPFDVGALRQRLAHVASALARCEVVIDTEQTVSHAIAHALLEPLGLSQTAS